MKLTFNKLILEFRKSTEVIPFPRLCYFYGPIGSGKSSIGRLIDYCLGAKIPWTPALQQEFISASLELKVEGNLVTLHRERDSNLVVAAWQEREESIQVVIQARDADEEVLPNTGVRVLSDLLFYIAKEEPPRVRRRKGRPDERLERLSFRDLYRYCYLDQEGMDSDFFRLNSENYASAQKSIDALRYIFGYRTELVTELESQLQSTREQRLGIQAGAEALKKALSEAGFDEINELETRIEETQALIEQARRAAIENRRQRSNVPHAADELREKARSLSLELISLQQSSSDLNLRISDLERHSNELQMLSVRYQRTASARTLIAGVQFKTCPRCTQFLPQREPNSCAVCGQIEHVCEGSGTLSEVVIDKDLKARQAELKEALQKMKTHRRSINLEIGELTQEKSLIDQSLSNRLRDYDSAFLSQALEHERVVVTLEQKLNALFRYRKLPDVLHEQLDKAEELLGDEAKLRNRLGTARKDAFQDRENLKSLSDFFLDCLVRCKFPDVKETYSVLLEPSNFRPEIPLGTPDALVFLSFENAGSGGMMALFKACFALAIHRVCAKLKDYKLPPVIVIDTATKNVSSVENPEVIKAFYQLVYELAKGELSSVQFIIIDNEFNPPPEDYGLELKVRHMVKGDPAAPPLIPYLSAGFEEESS